MENLFYGIDKETCISYDLKGSKINRFLKSLDIGLDTNFLIDFNSEPLAFDHCTYDLFVKIILDDCKFLAN